MRILNSSLFFFFITLDFCISLFHIVFQQLKYNVLLISFRLQYQHTSLRFFSNRKQLQWLASTQTFIYVDIS